ncbi:hypothetical protein [Sphingomonas phage Kharn]|uniref:Uncharacterized protein n=1 Tax=Sphingomonas phage Kharn TaxID=2686312 RepID=A0A6M3TC51_9CAUD|nr:hypothetical protein P9A29_gp40 [Sphingomonas phage Kharn]QJD54542.1 hypothetical protein [Sphingomonas phage Kharn]
MEAEVISRDEAESAYPMKVRDFDATAKRIAHMAGLGRGLALDPKLFFKLNTSLTTSPDRMAYATKPRWSKEEAMAIARAKYGV